MLDTTKIDPAPQQAEIDLKDPVLAAVFAWLIPGLGHWYQGRRSKAILFFVCIMGTFSYGLYLGGGRVVYASFKEEDRRLPYICQIGVGLPALPALVQAQFANGGKEPPLGKFMAPPSNVNNDRADHNKPDDLDNWNKELGRFFELGTVYTMIAGLLNVLVIYDAWGGPAYADESPPPN